MASFTRSNYKCCISGITLDTSEAIEVTASGAQKIIHARLWNSWSLKHGFEFLPDGLKNVTGATGSSVPTEGLKAIPANFKEIQQQFILEQLFLLRAEIMIDHELAKEQLSALLKYIKVLFSWFLHLDAQCAIIELNRFIETLQVFIASGQTDAAENTLNLLQMIMVSIFNGPTFTEVVSGIDEIQARTVASETALWRYIILANGVISTEEYTF